MKKIMLIILTGVLLISCSEEIKENNIKISGKLISPYTEDIKLILHDTEVVIDDIEYIAKVNPDSTFSFDIKYEKPLAGIINLGGFYHDIFLIPGDNLNIISEEDTIFYSGKGSDRNNFLYKTLEKGGYENYSSVFRSEKTLNEAAEFVSDESAEITELLNNLPNNNLEKDFLIWLKISSKAKYDEFMNYYPSYYGYKNKVNIDTVELPQSFQSAMKMSNFLDDSKLASRNYLNSLNNFVYSTARSLAKKDTIKFDKVVNNIMFDSLHGKSRDYAIAHKLKRDFTMNRFDTLIYQRFNEEITNPHAKEIVENSYQKYLEIQKLLNSPLNDEFKMTMLADDKGNELTFAEMIKKYEGKIVYLDIWSLGCGPCIANMPKSKELKDKLRNRPIEFVYITVDGMFDNLWEKVYEVTFIKKNHYRFTKSLDARMLKFLEINWVPNYMLFDKNSDLISYTAIRPDNPNCEDELLKYLN